MGNNSPDLPASIANLASILLPTAEPTAGDTLRLTKPKTTNMFNTS